MRNNDDPNKSDSELEEESVKIVKERRGHALEKFFNVPEGSTETEKVSVSYPVKRHELYDDKDSEIEKEFHTIFEKSMEGYESLAILLDSVDPRYRGRLAEIAASYLNTALNAVSKKAAQKEAIQTMKLKENTAQNKTKVAGSTTNIAFVGDHNSALKILKMIKNREKIETIDADVIEFNDEEDAQE